MSRLLAAYWRVLSLVGGIEAVSGACLLLFIVASITTQVFARYLFGEPLLWTEEAATYAFIWCVFLGAAAGYKRSRHIRIETFVSRLSPRGEGLLQGLAHAVILAVAVTLAVQALGVAPIEASSATVSLPWPLPRSWFYSVPLLVGCTSIAASALYFVAIALQRASADPPP